MIRIQPIVPDEASSRLWWESIVNQVAAGVPTAWELLYRSLFPLRFEIAAKVGRDHADDLYHDTIVSLVDAIRKRRLRTAEAVPAFARTIAGRRVCMFLREAVLARATVDAASVPVRDRSPNPEQERMRTERYEIAARILAATPAGQRELLARFYVKRESAAEIQRSMRLTATQFRLMKSRAMACFGERGRAYLTGSARAPRRSRDAAVRQV
jgi:RNA polymerase sigma factor (sigma-70 family)